MFTPTSIHPNPNGALGKFSHYRRSLSTNSTLSSISSSLTPPTSHEPRTPLFLRPLVYSSSVSDIQTFFNWARALANSVGSIFVQTDNGPDSTLLLRELRWFLEDTIEDTSLVSELGYSQNDARVVNLRASLEQMYELWNQRIKERKPFQYIVGCEHWRDLVLSVEEGVLIPRPETEKIVDLVGDLVRDNESLREGLWADLGTGSGALAIGIATILGRNGRVIATDVSPISLAVANFNVQRYGLQDVVEIKEGSWFDPLMHAEGELAGLVSNPPYIPSANISGLQAEVAKHEPRLALDGGFEGVDDLLYLCRMAARMLKSGGYFAFETNGGEQCELLASYIANEIGDSFQHGQELVWIPRGSNSVTRASIGYLWQSHGTVQRILRDWWRGIGAVATGYSGVANLLRGLLSVVWPCCCIQVLFLEKQAIAYSITWFYWCLAVPLMQLVLY